jgi:hypothetical protein
MTLDPKKHPAYPCPAHLGQKSLISGNIITASLQKAANIIRKTRA